MYEALLGTSEDENKLSDEAQLTHNIIRTPANT